MIGDQKTLQGKALDKSARQHKKNICQSEIVRQIQSSAACFFVFNSDNFWGSICNDA
jgi:hypothetical protein